MHVLGALNFPPIGELVDWKKFGPLGFNKTALVDVLAVIITLGIFFMAARRKALIPKGIQNVAESVIDFITDGIILQTIGPDGMQFLPFLLTLFLFIFFCNIFEIIPLIQFPANARMANPLFMAVIVWVLFMYMGFKRQGFGGYLKSTLFPPGVPKALYVLVTPIEFLSTFLVRPFSLAVRLFANMLAGHLLLLVFYLATWYLFTLSIGLLFSVTSFVVTLLVTLLEVLITALQAFIFTTLTAFYLSDSLSAGH